MCGISGVVCFKKPIPAVKAKLSAFLSQATYVGSLRGRHSTGVMAITREDLTATVVKKAVDGATFVDNANFDRVLYDLEKYYAAVVHNRKATMGVVNARNAHPFEVGPITLVHNGTLFSHKSLGGGNDLTVDSEAIAYGLANKPKLETLEYLDGAYALIWHDSRDNTFNMARNDDRPLSVAYLKDSESLLFCSEREMLDWLIVRNKIEVDAIMSPKAHTLYSWQLDSDDLSIEAPSIVEYESIDDYDYPGWNYYKGSKAHKYQNRARYLPQKSRSYVDVPSNRAVNESNTKRTDREQALARFGLKIGDTVEFISYKWAPYERNHTSIGHGVLSGLDIAMQFEIIAYGVQGQANPHDMENWKCSGEVITVKDDASFPNWITVVVGNIHMEEAGYWENYNRRVSKSAELPEQCDKECKEICDACKKSLMVEECDESDEVDDEYDDAEFAETVVEVVRGPDDKAIAITEWEKLTKYGCANCGMDFSHPDEVVWLHDGACVCSVCSSMWDVNNAGVYC